MFKFHMRVYFLVAVFPDCRRNRAAVYYNAEIAKAKKPCVLPLVVAACVMLHSVCVKLTRVIRACCLCMSLGGAAAAER